MRRNPLLPSRYDLLPGMSRVRLSVLPGAALCLAALAFYAADLLDPVVAGAPDGYLQQDTVRFTGWTDNIAFVVHHGNGSRMDSLICDLHNDHSYHMIDRRYKHSRQCGWTLTHTKCA